MACYYCNYCGNLKDGDYNCCSKDPRPGQGLLLVCEDCIVEIEEALEAELAEEAAMEEEINGEDYRKPRVPFNLNQRFI